MLDGLTALSVDIRTIARVVSTAGIGDDLCADDVGQRAFVGVQLDHRDVFQRSRMEHQFRAFFVEHPADAVRIAHIRRIALAADREFLADFQIDRIKLVFRVVD